MRKVLKSALGWIVFPACLALALWLVNGDLDHLLVFDLFGLVSLPIAAAFLLLFALWSALPRWRRLENDERILWSANLPSRIGSFAEAVLSPSIALPSLTLVRDWTQTGDYLRLAGTAALLAVVLWIVQLGIRMAIDAGTSVKVSAEGIQLGGRRIGWSQVEVIESGFASLKGGAAIVLADDRIVLSPHEHGPTGRALLAAVQRFSPETNVREPSFQADFAAAPA